MSDVFLSNRANNLLRNYLEGLGHRIIEVGGLAPVDAAVAAHPDIYLCRVRNRIVMAPMLHAAIRNALDRPDGSPGLSVMAGASSPSGAYPGDIPYNGACFGRFFLHNLKYTEPALLQIAADCGLTLIHVNQGYAKCNIVIVDENSIITADQGISTAAGRHGIDTLLVVPGHVRLEGHPYGFIGGASGRIGSQIVFSGDLSCHPDFEAIQGFIRKKGLETIYFKEYPLEDIGSVIDAGPQSIEPIGDQP